MERLQNAPKDHQRVSRITPSPKKNPSRVEAVYDTIRRNQMEPKLNLKKKASTKPQPWTRIGNVIGRAIQNRDAKLEKDMPMVSPRKPPRVPQAKASAAVRKQLQRRNPMK